MYESLSTAPQCHLLHLAFDDLGSITIGVIVKDKES